MALNDISEKKNKSIAFVYNTEEDEGQGGEILLEVIALVGRKLNNCLKKRDRQWRKNVLDKVSDISPLNKTKDDYKPNKGKGAQCYECEEFAHIKIECSTFLKKQKKRFSITWSNSDDESEGQITNKVMAFIEKYDSCSESNDEDISTEQLT